MGYSIVALLDPKGEAFVRKLWSALDGVLDVEEGANAPFPHFTFMVMDGIKEDPLRASLRQEARMHQPLVVRTAGLGMFLKPGTVLFANVVRDPYVDMLHRLISERGAMQARGLSPFYSSWYLKPHITLARGFPAEQFGEGIEVLRHNFVDGILDVTALALVHSEDGVHTIIERFAFGG